MRLGYCLLSSTFGMHQYTADLANRALQSRFGSVEPWLITTNNLPRDRYAPELAIRMPAAMGGTGFSAEGLRLTSLAHILDVMASANPDVVHITGVHAWNPLMATWLRRRGIRVIHTLHDLDPHHGVRYGSFIRLWNRWVMASVDHVLVHAERYRRRLIASGKPAEAVTMTPLLHLCFGAAVTSALEAPDAFAPIQTKRERPTVLFFGRVERYKGADMLLEAWRRLGEQVNGQMIIAGPIAADVLLPDPPKQVELRDHLILDQEALELFQVADLLVLPYRDATQSALVALAYRFGVPVLATQVGALDEYVVPGETGWLVAPEVEALREGLALALENVAALGDMGRAGRQWYEKQRCREARDLAGMYQQVGRR